jgi:hypothetical protein
MTPEMDLDKNGTMNWFFDEWVYGTDVPAYKFEYQIAADGAVPGKITQFEVSKNFVMIVPIYLDFGRVGRGSEPLRWLVTQPWNYLP